MKCEPELVADPYREKYPNDDYADCVARSIYDMQNYFGRAYFGAGDYWRNRGPVPVYSCGRSDCSFDIRHEITVDEEMVEFIHCHGGILFIPGADATGGPNGNVYYKDGEDSAWVKKPTIPNAIHVGDLARFRNDLFVGVSQRVKRQSRLAEGTPRVRDSRMAVLKSDDWQNWQDVEAPFPEEWYGVLLPLDECLLMVGEKTVASSANEPLVMTYADGVVTPYKPDEWLTCPYLMKRFGAGAVFTYHVPWAASPGWQDPLHYMEDWNVGPQHIEAFGSDEIGWIRDLVVHDDKLYVLTLVSELDHGRYLARIEESRNLKRWRRTSEFVLPAMPFSFETLDDGFLIGVGQKQWPTPEEPDSGSGTLWWIKP